MLLATKFPSARQFKNSNALFSSFLNARRHSQMYKKNQKTKRKRKKPSQNADKSIFENFICLQNDFYEGVLSIKV